MRYEVIGWWQGIDNGIDRVIIAGGRLGIVTYAPAVGVVRCSMRKLRRILATTSDVSAPRNEYRGSRENLKLSPIDKVR